MRLCRPVDAVCRNAALRHNSGYVQELRVGRVVARTSPQAFTRDTRVMRRHGLELEKSERGGEDHHDPEVLAGAGLLEAAVLEFDQESLSRVNHEIVVRLLGLLHTKWRPLPRSGLPSPDNPSWVARSIAAMSLSGGVMLGLLANEAAMPSPESETKSRTELSRVTWTAVAWALPSGWRVWTAFMAMCRTISRPVAWTTGRPVLFPPGFALVRPPWPERAPEYSWVLGTSRSFLTLRWSCVVSGF